MDRPRAEAILTEIRRHRGLVVLRGFDDDSPEQFWLLEMTGPQLEQWWQDREEFWWPVTPESQKDHAMLAKVFGEPGKPPPLRPPLQLPGTFLPGQFEHYGEDDLLSALWISFREFKRHYHCRICCNGDSFLLAPDGRRLYHKSHPGRKTPPL